MWAVLTWLRAWAEQATSETNQGGLEQLAQFLGSAEGQAKIRQALQGGTSSWPSPSMVGTRAISSWVFGAVEGSIPVMLMWGRRQTVPALCA